MHEKILKLKHKLHNLQLKYQFDSKISDYDRFVLNIKLSIINCLI